MRRFAATLVLSGTCSLFSAGAALAQGRGGNDWVTAGSDPHRSSWVRTDAKISPDSMQKPGFAFLWKVKLNNDPRQMNSLSSGVTMDRYIGYRGFRSMAYVGGSSDGIFAFDSDLGRIEWQKKFPGGSAQAGTPACPGGLTAAPARPASLGFPATPGAGGGGRGRGNPAKSAVGEPGEGAAILKELEAAAAARAAGGGRGRGGFGGGGGGQASVAAPGAPKPAAGGGRGRQPSFLFAVSSDGMFHSMYVSNGEEPYPAVKFLGPNANVSSLTVVDGVAYATTSNGCGGVPDGVYALDFDTEQVASFKAEGGVAGDSGAAFGPDGTIYIATGAGDLVALEPKTLQKKDSYKSGSAFVTSPVVFEMKDEVMVAAGAKDGIHVLNTKSLGSAAAKHAGTVATADLASWQDTAGTRWLLVPTVNEISALKVAGEGSALSVQQGWNSRDLNSPITPMIINGVVFAVSSGAARASDPKMTAAQLVQRSTPAVLYALNAETGKEFWNSGKTMTSFVTTGGLSGSGSQLYLGTYDGTFYAFGFPIEH